MLHGFRAAVLTTARTATTWVCIGHGGSGGIGAGAGARFCSVLAAGNAPTHPHRNSSIAMTIMSTHRLLHVETQPPPGTPIHTGPTMNRWLAVPPAIATTACIGSLYAFSVFSDPLCRTLGVVHGSGDDWTLSSVVPIFSTILAFHGISAAVFGKWQEKVGPRVSILAGAFCYGGGYLLGAVGAMVHSIPLLVVGYGVIAGTGVGLAYTPPMATLLRWFPDRRGLATGMALCGFGGGALITTPIAELLLKWSRKLPEYLGPAENLEIITQNGRRFVQDAAAAVAANGGSGSAGSSGAGLREIVVASASDISSAGFSAVTAHPGVYAVGTGSTGVCTTFGILGLGYFVVMAASAWAIRAPPLGYLPPHMIAAANAAAASSGSSAIPTPAGGVMGAGPVIAATAATATSSAETATITKKSSFPPLKLAAAEGHVHPDVAIRTPQFWQVWTQVACMAAGGFALASVAKTMMAEIFGTALPHVVTAAFASSFVMAMSVANLGGRLGWASFSDIAGRKITFVAFSLLSVPLYLCMSGSASMVSTHPTIVPLAAFCASSLIAFSFFAGTYSTAPAMEADLFGSKYVGAIHGRVLTANSAAALVGPPAIAALRGSSEVDAIHKLAQQVPTSKFFETFGAPITELEQLIKAKTVTIHKLLELLPAGTIDPTPFLYNTTIYSMVGLMAFSTVVAAGIRPVAEKHKEKL